VVVEEAQRRATVLGSMLSAVQSVTDDVITGRWRAATEER
jgi:hypothetical protein